MGGGEAMVPRVGPTWIGAQTPSQSRKTEVKVSFVKWISHCQQIVMKIIRFVMAIDIKLHGRCFYAEPSLGLVSPGVNTFSKLKTLKKKKNFPKSLVYSFDCNIL